MNMILNYLILIFVLVALNNCNWYDDKSQYITIYNSDDILNEEYSTTKELLLIKVKQYKFDLLGLNKIIFSNMLESYHINSYIIPPDEIDVLKKYLVGEIVDTKVIAKGSIMRVSDIRVAKHRYSYLFIPLSDNNYYSIAASVYLKSNEKCTSRLTDQPDKEFICYFSNSLETLSYNLKMQSYILNIPYLKQTRHQKTYKKNIKILFLDAKKYLSGG